ncbi:uncharacterized protein [Rhodnius prolixus]|uniref:Uncharacterized protein n=1 Tax=Rhodnius prolixus TaxID=13249 RepID=T1HVK1_RHOPR
MSQFLRVLLLTLAVKLVLADQVVINQAIDQLLESAKIILRSRGQDKIHVPKMDKTFEKKVMKVVTIKGEFQTSEGLFQDTTSLHRTGDVTMNAQGNRLTLAASMGLSKLAIDFGHYEFSLLAIHSSGSLHAECNDNALSAEITIVHDGPKCSVELNHARIDRLGNFVVKMTGPDQLNELGSVLFTWILNQFNENIRSLVNSHIESAIRESLNKVDLCKMIPH